MSFIEGTNYQWLWSASSLDLLKDCPRKYYYAKIENWTSRDESPHLKFGTLFHKARDLFDRKRRDMDHEAALDEVVWFLLKETWKDGKPWETNHSKKTRETLLRSVIWALDNYREDPMETILLQDGKPAVELEFQLELDKFAPDGRRYALRGIIDRLVKFGENTYVVEYKTTGSTLGGYYFAEFNPHNQMSLYTLAGRVVYRTPVSGVIIDAAQIAVGFTAFGRSITTRSDSQLEEFLNSVGVWLDLAERFAATESWPMNESSCNKFGGCPFRKVCSQDPKVRKDFLETYFEKKPQEVLR